uniref:PI-PLC Y-box domain-containing protein n=1 Tax=Ciona savignyi TaxID=51511 RepID=H2Y8L5_CIOSA
FRLAKNKLKESITFHELQLSRTYPAGTRTDSSNYDPLPLWNAGFQVGKTSNFDESSLQVEVLTSGDPADTNRCLTRFDKNSGFDPKWNDEFIIYISKPDLAMVKFMVKTQNHERIGQNTMPFTSIAQGYRYIPMLDRSGARIPSASLFVFVEINDAVVQHVNPGRVKVDIG